MNKGIIITNLVFSILTFLLFIGVIVTIYILIKKILPDAKEIYNNIPSNLNKDIKDIKGKINNIPSNLNNEIKIIKDTINSINNKT